LQKKHPFLVASKSRVIHNSSAPTFGDEAPRTQTMVNLDVVPIVTRILQESDNSDVLEQGLSFFAKVLMPEMLRLFNENMGVQLRTMCGFTCSE
jgi:hypothetical protein